MRRRRVCAERNRPPRTCLLQYLRMQLDQPPHVLVAGSAAEAAFSGDAEIRQKTFARGDAAARAFDTVGVMHQPQVDAP